MVKHNNVVPNGHFRKHWKNYVKTWFNQPARKDRRRLAQQKKAVKISHGQEQAAGIPKKLAPTIGIAVDHHRKNQSLEGLHANVQRLKKYKAKLVVFPRRPRKFKAGDSTPEVFANATQVQGTYLPILREKPAVELVEVTDEMKSFNAYAKLQVERMNKRHVGARMKKDAEAEKEDKE